jgi:hypothetical protein
MQSSAKTEQPKCTSKALLNVAQEKRSGLTGEAAARMLDGGSRRRHGKGGE